MNQRKPAAFRISPQEEKKPEIKFTPLPGGEEKTAIIAPAPHKDLQPRRFKWGAVFITSLVALLSLGIGLYIAGLIEQLFAANPWLGWAGSGLLALGGLAAIILAGREILALLRQRRITRIKTTISTAHNEDNAKQAMSAQKALQHLYEPRDDMSWGLARLAEHDGDILDADARIALLERELMRPLDIQARAMIATTAKRISVITALSPSALVDISFVAALNLRLLRQLASLYGGRPGALGIIRIARMVLTHLAITGGIALGDDMINQVLGHSLMSKISSRLGEGVLNGALSARIGLAAMQICRPMPFITRKPPKLKDMLGEILKS